MRRLSVLLLLPALLGCANLERAFLVMAMSIVAGAALHFIAWGAIQTRRGKLGPKQRVIIGAVSMVALGIGTYALVESLVKGLPLPRIHNVGLIACSLLWLPSLLIVARGTRTWVTAVAVSSVYALVALVTAVWLWPGARLPEGEIVELAVSNQTVCVRYEDGSIVCRGVGDGTPGRWPMALNMPPASALHPGPCQTCASTSSGEVWCWRHEIERIGQWDGLDAIIVRRGGLLLRRSAEWSWHAVELDWWAEACGSDRDDTPRAIDGLANASEVAATNEYLCKLEDRAVVCRLPRRFDPDPDARDWSPIVWFEVPLDHVYAGGDDLVCASDDRVLRCVEWEDELELAAPPDSVAIGSLHACVRFGDRVECAGFGRGGVLGSGEDRSWRTVQHELPGLTQISVRDELTCALHAGSVSCWGRPSGFRLMGDPRLERRGPLRDALNPRWVWDEPSPFRD